MAIKVLTDAAWQTWHTQQQATTPAWAICKHLTKVAACDAEDGRVRSLAVHHSARLFTLCASSCSAADRTRVVTILLAASAEGGAADSQAEVGVHHWACL